MICLGSHGLEGAGPDLQPCASDPEVLAAPGFVGGSVGNYSRGNCMQTELWGVSSRSDRPGWFVSRLTNGNDHEETARNKINFGKGMWVASFPRGN